MQNVVIIPRTRCGNNSDNTTNVSGNIPTDAINMTKDKLTTGNQLKDSTLNPISLR